MIKIFLKKRIYLILLIIAFITFLCYRYFFQNNAPIEQSNEGNKGRATPVDIYVAKATPFTSGIQAIGTLFPNEEVELISEATGKVTEIYFKEGTQVPQGQLLLKVDDADLQSQLKRAEHQLNLTSERLNRQRILLEKEAVSREEFDLVQTDYNILQADIDLLKVKIDRTEIRAPFSGIVGFRGVSVGSFLQPNTIITTLVDQSQLKIEFSIPEKYASLPLMGKKILFKTELSDNEYEAIIYAIEPKVDQKTRTISLRAMYDNSNRKLAAGMFTRLKILTENLSDVILLPTQSIVPEMDGKKVWVLENGRTTSRSVTTGVRTETQVEILSGIINGDSILTTGLLQVKEGATVKVASVQ